MTISQVSRCTLTILRQSMFHSRLSVGYHFCEFFGGSRLFDSSVMLRGSGMMVDQCGYRSQ